MRGWDFAWVLLRRFSGMVTEQLIEVSFNMSNIYIIQPVNISNIFSHSLRWVIYESVSTERSRMPFCTFIHPFLCLQLCLWQRVQEYIRVIKRQHHHQEQKILATRHTHTHTPSLPSTPETLAKAWNETIISLGTVNHQSYVKIYSKNRRMLIHSENFINWQFKLYVLC